jgi:hypothetical protein
MQQFIKEANIRLFEAKLTETNDPKERAEIRRLLAAERATPITPANNPAPGPGGGREE